MMQKLLIKYAPFILLLILFMAILLCSVNAQININPVEKANAYFKNTTQYGQLIPRGWFPNLIRIPNVTTADIPTAPGAIASNGVNKLFVWDGAQWNETTNTTIIQDSSGNVITADTLAGGPFTSVPQVGFNPGSNLTPAQIVSAAFYASQPPTATLTGGQTLELMADGADLGFTLNWTAGRNFATQPLNTITVAGVNKSFAQPALNTSVSGTQAVTVVRNSNTTFVMDVTTTDGKTATTTTSILFAAKRYAGWNTTNSLTDANILAGNINEFSGVNSKTWTQLAPTTASYFFYAYPSSFGDLTHFIINGFESISSFTLTKRNVQNASGYVQQYNVYVSNNKLAFGLSNQAY